MPIYVIGIIAALAGARESRIIGRSGYRADRGAGQG